MIENGINLLHHDGLADSVLQPFADELACAGIPLSAESQPSEPQAGVEFLLIPAVAIYVAKFFVEDLLKRAAKDLNDIMYPKLKASVAALAKRIYLTDRPIKIFATPGKVTHPESLMFAVYAEMQDGKRVKFLFIETLSDSQYDAAIDAMFSTLANHYGHSEKLDVLANPPPTKSWEPVLLSYERETNTWKVVSWRPAED